MFNWLKNLFNLSPRVIEAAPSKKLYIIDVLSAHRIRYAVECTPEKLEEILSNLGAIEELVEFSSQHLGDRVVSYHPTSEEQYFKTFAEENVFLEDWTNEQKLELINRK